MGKLNKKGGRTLNLTVEDLMQSKRLEIAVRNFKEDPQLLKAILIELGMESINVSKNTIIKTYRAYSSLDQYELVPLLKSVNDFNTFNIFWSLTRAEMLLYQADPKFQHNEEERKALLQKVKVQLMGS